MYAEYYSIPPEHLCEQSERKRMRACVQVFVCSEVTLSGWLGVKTKELTNVDALRVHVCLGVREGEKMGNCISTLVN